jgi:ribosomal-protein-alanine N-acetyltransferase
MIVCLFIKKRNMLKSQNNSPSGQKQRLLQEHMSYIVRRMQDRDIPQGLEIDREAFPTQWPHPTYASFKQELRNRLACYIVVAKPTEIEAAEPHTDDNSFWQKFLRFFGREHIPGKGIPALNEYIVGLAGFWVMVDEAHITTLAVRDAYRRQGIGEQLLIEIIERAAQLKANVVTLEARISNKQAQALYQKYGFQKVGVRRAYYTDNGEDAILMTTDSLTSDAFNSHFQQLKHGHIYRWGELYINETSKVA